MCTSFLDYRANKIYAMNFDLADVKMKVMIKTGKENKYFMLCAEINKTYYPIVGMNENGDFVNFQMMYFNEEQDPPFIEEIPENICLNNNKINYLELFLDYLEGKKNYNDILAISENSFFESPENFLLHSFFACKDNRALIIENIDWKMRKVELKDNFMAMTNFPNYLYRDKHYQEIDGLGNDRYKIAFEELENFKSIDVKSSFEILSKTFQSREDMKTLCSLVFLPDKKEIYFAVRQNLEEVWKVSLERGMIERVNDSKGKKVVIQEEGILLKDLPEIFK